MDLGLRGKVAIVTGSSDGIALPSLVRSRGRERALVRCARRETLLVQARDAIVKETGADVLALTCDVQRLDDVKRLVDATMQRFSAMNILANNAGSVPAIQFTDVTDARWYEMLERKLLGYLRMTREVVPQMQKAGWGRIVNVAGTAGWEPSNTAMAVGINTAAVLNWTKSMSLQYGAEGILVTAVAPGSIDTPRQVNNRQREAEVAGNVSRSCAKAAWATFRYAASAGQRKWPTSLSFSLRSVRVT